jgi:hypothetical protein
MLEECVDLAKRIEDERLQTFILTGLPVLRGFSRNVKQDSEVSAANGGVSEANEESRTNVGCCFGQVCEPRISAYT